MQTLPIGIFDSGFGGLSVLRKLAKSFPDEHFIYFADTSHLPYGEKSKELIIERTLKCAHFLQKHPIKMLVVACHTACVYALDILKEELDIPVIGISESVFLGFPKKIEAQSIGIIATKATIASNYYQMYLAKKCPYAQIVAIAAPLLVPIIEEGKLGDALLLSVIEQYFSHLKETKLDLLFLGCTHYPLILELFHAYAKKVIDPAGVCVDQCRKFLTSPLSDNSSFQFYVTDDVEKFLRIGRLFFPKMSKVWRISI